MLFYCSRIHFGRWICHSVSQSDENSQCAKWFLGLSIFVLKFIMAPALRDAELAGYPWLLLHKGRTDFLAPKSGDKNQRI